MSLELNDFTLMSLAEPSLQRVTINPLEQINLKNLADTPAQLQMLLRLQNYDVTIKYCPGKEMLVADALSRYSPLVGPEVALDIAIHHVHITPEKKLEFQRTIQDDPPLCTLV